MGADGTRPRARVRGPIRAGAWPNGAMNHRLRPRDVEGERTGDARPDGPEEAEMRIVLEIMLWGVSAAVGGLIGLVGVAMAAQAIVL